MSCIITSSYSYLLLAPCVLSIAKIAAASFVCVVASGALGAATAAAAVEKPPNEGARSLATWLSLFNLLLTNGTCSESLPWLSMLRRESPLLVSVLVGAVRPPPLLLLLSLQANVAAVAAYALHACRSCAA